MEDAQILPVTSFLASNRRHWEQNSVFRLALVRKYWFISEAVDIYIYTSLTYGKGEGGCRRFTIEIRQGGLEIKDEKADGMKTLMKIATKSQHRFSVK